jgi:yeast amino acid transporter
MAESRPTSKSEEAEKPGSGWSDAQPSPMFGDEEGPSFARRFIDSFKRDPNAHESLKAILGSHGNGHVYDVESAAARTADSPLARKLKGRHLQMIAIGGSIGMFLLEQVKFAW